MKYNTEYHGVIDLDNITEEDFKEITGNNLKTERKLGKYITFLGSAEDVKNDGRWTSKRINNDH